MLPLDKLVKYVGIPGALVAGATLWTTLGFPTIATSMDIQKLNRQQADHAVELYRGKVRGLLSIPQPKEEPGATIWREEIEQARRERDKAEQRQIELSK